jgi:ATP-binding cassette subfamily B protein
MFRLAKYLKPYLLLILLAILLLFVQANCDLALPDYMSEIVNNGIQQGGIENAVPTAIRQSEMNKVFTLLSGDEKGRVLSDYSLADSNSSNYQDLLKTVPGVKNEPVYILKDISKEEITWLNPVMGKGLLAVSAIEQLMADPEKAAALGKSAGFDLSKLPAGTDIFSIIGKLPEAQRAQISSAMEEKFAALGDSMITQSAVSTIKAEYKALGMNTDSIQSGYILRTGSLMLLVSLLSVACTIVVGFLSARTAAGLSRDLRKSVFQKVENFSNIEFDHFSTASLITRNTNDITQIQMFVIIMIRMVAYAPIMGIGGIIRAIGKDSSMWWIIAIAVMMLISLVLIVYFVAVPKFKLTQKLIDRLNLVMRENLSGMMVIRAFNMQGFEQKRFNNANQDLTDVTLFVNRVMVTMFPAMTLIMNGLTLLIIWVGSHQVAQSAMQVGDMMAFMQYAIQIVFSFLMMSMMFILLPRASVSADRIAEVLAIEPSIKDSDQPVKFPSPFKGLVEFQNVSFRYPGADEDVLHDLTFAVKPGETTAIIGATGSGKSTVVNLVPRFYDVTAGKILVDGMDIRNVTQHDLREKIGFIPQKSILFSGTIESNLHYADDNASAEVLNEAADIAQASEFIDSSPEKMSAEISQGGANVSGGQKQRLSIARALVKRAPIYIFDDSFSALDFKTDSALRKAMKEKTANSALMIVTQRVSTIKNAEQIIVLDDGKIVGKGTHQELMKSCDTYREIALSQLSMEELS